MLWHAFLFLGLRFFLFSSFCLVASTTFSCKKVLYDAGGLFSPATTAASASGAGDQALPSIITGTHYSCDT
jgi:hypothetical protein